MTLWMVAVGTWVITMIVVLSLCKAAARADRMAEEMNEREEAKRRHPSGGTA